MRMGIFCGWEEGCRYGVSWNTLKLHQNILFHLHASHHSSSMHSSFEDGWKCYCKNSFLQNIIMWIWIWSPAVEKKSREWMWICQMDIWRRNFWYFVRVRVVVIKIRVLMYFGIWWKNIVLLLWSWVHFNIFDVYWCCVHLL